LAHINEIWEGASVGAPIAVLLTSLLGSSHCVAMCGGIFFQCKNDRASISAYHLGRFFGYSCLGLLCGFIGEKILRFPYANWVAASLLVGVSILMAIKAFGRKVEFSIIPKRLVAVVQRAIGKLLPQISTNICSAISVGILTAFLPCGWLSTFILVAVATRSPFSGALTLFAFWLGTIPALTLSHYFLHQASPWSRRVPLVSSLLFLTVALGTVGIKMYPKANGSATSCHSSHTLPKSR
jgi:sulfite exporter TauE/SafE